MLSFLVQLVVIGLRHDPLPEVGVGRILDWHEAVADLRLEFKQFLKSFVPIGSTSHLPFETNTIEHSNTLLCHGTWLSFQMQPVVAALDLSPHPELGVGSVLL